MENKEQVNLKEETPLYIKHRFNKKHFLILTSILFGIYLLAMGFVWIVKITGVEELDLFSGSSQSKGKYIKGEVVSRTKALPAVVHGREEKGWYYFMIPYGKKGKYIIVYTDESQYERFKTLPEVNPSKEDKQEWETGVSLTGKIEKLSSPVYEDLQEMLGITENGNEDAELEQEQKMNEMANMQVVIKVMDYKKEQARLFGIVTFVWLAIVLGVIYRGRKWIWERESKEVHEM